MIKSGTISLIVGIIAGLSAFYVYPETGVYSSLFVGLGAAWLLFSLTDPSRMLTMLKFTINPPMAGLIAFFVSFIYFSVEGFQFWTTFAASSTLAIFGGIAGFLLFNFWNIGS